VYRRRFGQAQRATHEPLDPCPQIAVLACDFLRLCCANRVLRRIDMTLVSLVQLARGAGGVSETFTLTFVSASALF